MQIDGLNYDEQMALVGLVKTTLISDDIVSAAESNKLKLITVYTGIDKFRKLLDDFNLDFDSPEKLKAHLLTIKNQQARELIYATVFEIALTESIDITESEILDWLVNAWNVEVKMQ